MLTFFLCSLGRVKGVGQLPFASSSLFDTFFFVRESGLSAAEGDVFLLRVAGGVEGAEVRVYVYLEEAGR